jgi:hypothetical protein
MRPLCLLALKKTWALYYTLSRGFALVPNLPFNLTCVGVALRIRRFFLEIRTYKNRRAVPLYGEVIQGPWSLAGNMQYSVFSWNGRLDLISLS